MLVTWCQTAESVEPPLSQVAATRRVTALQKATHSQPPTNNIQKTHNCPRHSDLSLFLTPSLSRLRDGSLCLFQSIWSTSREGGRHSAITFLATVKDMSLFMTNEKVSSTCRSRSPHRAAKVNFSEPGSRSAPSPRQKKHTFLCPICSFLM